MGKRLSLVIITVFFFLASIKPIPVFADDVVTNSSGESEAVTVVVEEQTIPQADGLGAAETGETSEDPAVFMEVEVDQVQPQTENPDVIASEGAFDNSEAILENNELQSPQPVSTEPLEQEEDISDIVALMAEEGLTLTDENGEDLSFASIETSQILSNSDPFFWDGTKWVGYTKTGSGCPENVTCLASDTPFQAAVTASSALGMETTIYVATGSYEEDIVINSAKKLSFTAFNSVTVDGVAPSPTNILVTNPGFATVRSILLNSDFGLSSGVYADKVTVGSGGQLNDALLLVNPVNETPTVEANLIVYGSGDHYRIKDANNKDTNFEWDCGEPQIPIYPGTNYRMVLKSPTDPDVVKYFQDNPDERALNLSAEERLEDLVLAANMSEQTVGGYAPWSNADEAMVFWNLLGHVKNVLGNANGVTPLTSKQQALANYITSGKYDDTIVQNQTLWFLWPNGSGQSPKNVQFTFLKYADPVYIGCADPASCTACPFGQELIAGLGCQPIVCSFGNQINAAGNGCESIVCKFGMKLNAAGDGCEPIVCDAGMKMNSVGDGCEPIICEVGSKLNAAGNGCEPIVCGTYEYLEGNTCVAIPASVAQAAGQTVDIDGVNPTLIPVTGGLLIPVTGTRIIVAGLGHTCMTAGNGQVLCWGLNESGQVGDGGNVNQLKPVFVKDLDEVVNLTAGSLHTCALKSNGEVWCWGENASGQLGDGTTSDSNLPMLVSELPDKAIAISGGEEFTCAMLMNNEVWCWGENNLGQLNDGTTSDKTRPVKALLNNVQNNIAAGQGELFGDAAGKIDTWTTQQANTIQEIGSSLFLFGDRWNQGGCAINMNGDVKCWDDNLVSSLVEKSKPAYMVETGLSHGCALNADGTVSCWGVNQYGQLGNGTNQDSADAVLVSGISTANEIGIGRQHSCVLVGAGNTALCWGENTYGQLGNDTTTDSNIPVYVIEP